ncbi:MAG: PD-(D/E)XK nuclease family protein [Spirochaetales bacterium]|nr:PD-(D/E)XK nuclease family protein [Spirochaetales bacterium]MCF7937522.1 PD-(D/E)XK nuclease family protein [Spirochaetales bacterium]
MDKFSQKVLEYAGKANTVLVFPSEISASFWRRACLRHLASGSTSGASAVRYDRFLSWDSLKERLILRDPEERPANRGFRSAFLSSFLSENARRAKKSGTLTGAPPFLKRLVPAPFSSQWQSFLPLLRNSLPMLQPFLELPETGKTLDPLLAEDLQLLYEGYREFLRENRRFEPAWRSAELQAAKTPSVIFFPSLIEDFPEYRAALEKDPLIEYVDIPGGKDPAETKPVYYRFSSTGQEIRWVLGRVIRRLEEGVPPEQIMISCGNLDRLENHLRLEARTLGLPLRFRRGKTVLEYPAGRVFQRLSDLKSGRMPYEVLRLLILDRGLPWRNREAAERFIELAGEFSVYRSGGGSGGDAYLDLLESLVRSDQSLEDLLSWYRRFADGLRNMFEADTLSRLRAGAGQFFSSIIPLEDFHSSERRVIQFALDRISTLDQELGELQGGGRIDPFSFWIEDLGQSRYVDPGGAPGIDVFDYRAAAGCAPAWHFVLNASQSATAYRRRRFAFLRDDEMISMGLEETDLSSHFLSAYRRSGGAVVFTYGEAGEEGIQLPAGPLLGAGLEPENPGPAGPDKQSLFEKLIEQQGLLRLEEELWKKEAGRSFDFPNQKASMVMRIGYRFHLGTGARSRGVDMRRDVLDPDSAAALISSMLRRDGAVYLGQQSLSWHRFCPLGFLLSQILEIEEDPHFPVMEDPRIRGMIVHKALAVLTESVAAEGGPFQAARLEEYRRLVNKVMKKITSAGGRRPVLPVWNAWIKRIERQLHSFLVREAEVFDGWDLVGTELELNTGLPLTLQDRTVFLNGRIDRLSGQGDKLAVIDYKSGKLPKNKDVSPDDPNMLAEFQMPVYFRLVQEEKPDYRVALLSYYGCKVDDKEGGYRHLLWDLEEKPPKKGPTLSPESFGLLAAEVDKAASKLVQAVEAGDYRVAGGDCSGCSYRRVCRIRFAVQDRDGSGKGSRA